MVGNIIWHPMVKCVSSSREEAHDGLGMPPGRGNGVMAYLIFLHRTVTVGNRKKCPSHLPILVSSITDIE